MKLWDWYESLSIYVLQYTISGEKLKFLTIIVIVISIKTNEKMQAVRR